MEQDLTKPLLDILEICGLPFNRCMLDEQVKTQLIDSNSHTAAVQEVLDFIKVQKSFELYEFSSLKIGDNIRYKLRYKE